MKSKTNARQLFQLQSVLFTNAEGVEDLDRDLVQGIIDRRVDAGRDFMTFLRNGGKVIVSEPSILHIDRSKPFSPVEFLGEGWTIEEEDQCSLQITQLDLTKVEFKDMLKEGESFITGEEKLKRLKEVGHVRLDAKIFQALWEDKGRIPSSWKESIGGNTRFIYFDGTILRSPFGRRCVLYLYWRGGEWLWHCLWLDSGFDAYDPSALLAS